MNKRIDWIDAVKGIGIILVIWSHVGFDIHKLVHYFCYGFMPIFYVMAGVTSRTSKDSYLQYTMKKAKRLMIPYFTYSVAITLILSAIDGDFGNISQELIGIIYGRYCYLRGGQEGLMLGAVRDCMIAPLWFLPSIFVAYQWLYIYDYTKNKKAFLLLMIFMAAIFVYPFQYLFPWSIDTSFMAFLFILIGRKISPILKQRNINEWLYVLVLSGLYICVCKLNQPVNFSIAQYSTIGYIGGFTFFILGVLEPVFLSFLCKIFQYNKIISLLAYVGRYSLRLMCIHIFIFKTSERYLIDYNFFEQHYAISFILCFSMIFIANYMLDVFYKYTKSSYARYL